MPRCTHLVSACAGAAVAGSLILALGLGPSQSGGSGAPPAKPPAAPTAPKAPAPPKKPGEGPAFDHTIPAPKDGGKPGVVPMPPEMAAAMEFMTPGPEHEWLAKKAGTWNMTGKMWMDPSMPPMEVTGTTVYRMILGGRYLHEEVKSMMMGEPFEAMGVTAFNRATGKFQLAWLDTMGTAITQGTATRSADGKTLNGTYMMFDPMAGKEVPARSVETRVDDDTFTYQMFQPGPTGTEMKVLEFSYKRAK